MKWPLLHEEPLMSFLTKPFLILLMAGLLLGVGCQSDSGGAAGPVVQDSAGVLIVLNPGPIPEVSPGWALSPEPTLSIGSVDGDEALQFFGIAGAHRLSGGRIGVVNAGSRDVRFYDADGRHLVAVGRVLHGKGRDALPEQRPLPVVELDPQQPLVARAHNPAEPDRRRDGVGPPDEIEPCGVEALRLPTSEVGEYCPLVRP